MPPFDSFEKFALHLMERATEHVIIMGKSLERAAKQVEKTAKAEIGEYQNAVGPWLEWEQLADSTEVEKRRLGYPEDAPLLRDGTLQESYSHEVLNWHEAIVGTPDPVGLYHEIGTKNMPPRPVLGPAVTRNEKLIKRVLAEGFLETLILQPGMPSLRHNGP
jgi:hypothetical protein